MAAAFGVKEWRVTEPEFEDDIPIFSGYKENDVHIAWHWNGLTPCNGSLSVESYSSLFWREEGTGEWICHLTPDLPCELLARGFYRLGKDESGLAPLNCPLSAHEKLELRLSMPREFWPQKWFDEVGDVWHAGSILMDAFWRVTTFYVPD